MIILIFLVQIDKERGIMRAEIWCCRLETVVVRVESSNCPVGASRFGVKLSGGRFELVTGG
jgi:hypothetical protein